MECTFCGMPLKGDDPDLVWSGGLTREPFCNTDCEVSEIADRLIYERGNRRRPWPAVSAP